MPAKFSSTSILTEPMKRLNLGAGGNILKDWENHDSDVDITKPLPWVFDTIDMIAIEHCVEHVSCPDGFRFFEECHRILKPDGVLRVCVPHLDRIQDKAHCRDLIVGHGHQVVFNLPLLINLLHLSGFRVVREVPFNPDIDGHWKVIGEGKDLIETLRVEAIK